MSAQSPASGLPPQVVLYQMASGHYLSHALALAARLGIAEHLADGPRDARQLADATGTHEPSLRRVLRLLVTAGVFEERKDGSFAQTPVSESLRAGVPGSARAAVMLFAGERMLDAWRDLEYCVRTGDPAFR